MGLSSPFTISKRSIYNVVTLVDRPRLFFLSFLLSPSSRPHKGWISSRLRFSLTVTFADCVGDGADWSLPADDRRANSFRIRWNPFKVEIVSRGSRENCTTGISGASLLQSAIVRHTCSRYVQWFITVFNTWHAGNVFLRFLLSAIGARVT